MVCKLLNLTRFNFPDYPVAEKLILGIKLHGSVENVLVCMRPATSL